MAPEQFQDCFLDWVKSIAEVSEGEVIAIDGKTLRQSYDNANGKGAIQMVSAWATANRLVLGQCKVESKSNEITAIPKLLKMLEVKGCIVTIDQNLRIDRISIMCIRASDYSFPVIEVKAVRL